MGNEKQCFVFVFLNFCCSVARLTGYVSVYKLETSPYFEVAGHKLIKDLHLLI